jgi:hypothetical protein
MSTPITRPTYLADSHQQAWQTLIDQLTAQGRLPTRATPYTTEEVTQVYIRSLVPGVSFQGAGAPSAQVIQRFITDQFGREGGPLLPVRPPQGVAGDATRLQAWDGMVRRLRDLGHRPTTVAEVHRMHLEALTPEGERAALARRFAEGGDLATPEKLAEEFNKRAGEQSRYRPDGREPPTPGLESEVLASPTNRLQAMSRALQGIPENQREIVGAMLAPTSAGQAGVIRPNGTGAAGLAVQRFLLSAVGDSHDPRRPPANMIRRIQGLLSSELPQSHPMYQYVQALRTQLQQVGARTETDIQTRLTSWLTDGRVGVTTDLAALIARQHTTGPEGGAPTSIMQQWATTVGAGRAGAAGTPIGQILNQENGGLLPRAFELAEQHVPRRVTPSAAPGG